MKIGKHYSYIAIMIGILCVHTLGEIELPPSDTLLGQPEPALRGLKQLYIIIRAPNAVPKSHGIVFEEIENSVAEKIKEAGITIAETDVNKMDPNSVEARTLKILKRRTDSSNVKNLKFRHGQIPELRVNIDVLGIKDSQQFVFHVQTSLARLVNLKNENRLSFKTEVWQSEPIMQIVSKDSMPAAVTSAVLEQVEAFIHAYMAANPPNKRPSEVNNISETTEEQLKPVAESTPGEYKYVASKSSKVFHKPDCIWVQRIKAENLVGYSSRDEAINAGKRPCKQCNP
jgi:hypothetical protein